MVQQQKEEAGHLQFQHTQLGVYLVGVCALVYTVGERGQVRRPCCVAAFPPRACVGQSEVESGATALRSSWMQQP